MNDSPGWVPPGSSPSGTPEPSDDQQQNQQPSGRPEGTEDQPAAPPRNWSQQQPPASAGWGAPTPPPEGAPPGWGPGAPGSKGHSAWNQPPAAKPGVIPLRPLGIGEILDGAVSTMRAHWRTVLGISLGVAIITQGVGTAAIGLWFQDIENLERLENDPNLTTDELLDVAGGLLGALGITLVVTLLGTILATAMLTMVVSRAVLGRTVSIGEAWRESRPQLLRLCGLLLLLPLLAGVVIVIGLLPGILATAGASLLVVGGLAAAAVVIWLWVLFSLAPPALMLERQGVIGSLRRSAKLVRGSWWRILGVLLLTQILVFIVSGVIEVPTDLIGTAVDSGGTSGLFSGSVPTGWTYLVITGIGSVIASAITFPISAGVTALLYLDQRIRREALDLELARAAGVPGFASPGDDAAPGS